MIVLIDAVGLTARLLPHAPRLAELAKAQWSRPLKEVYPAVTSTVQASLLTGKLPQEHGIVANGWLYRDTMEVRLWQQSNRLLQAEPIYQTVRRIRTERGKEFTCAKLFWWFNQGADVDIAITPKPYYAADGNKAFGITGTPSGLAERMERQHGKFPFHNFWGPAAGLPASEWIGKTAGTIVGESRPDLTLIYMPHLDYDPQRFGPAGCDMPRLVGELDAACAPILDAAKHVGASLWVVGEYGHCDVDCPIFPNRALRNAGLLTVRDGPFGENLDTFISRAFAVCDHQLCHVYVSRPIDVPAVRDVLGDLPGVARVLSGEERANIGLDHARSGELILLSDRRSWFAYPFWLDDARAPDYARTVDIHRKPGFDPCEMFLDPTLALPKLRIARRLAQKKLGFRTLFDVIPLDANIVRGSHGLPAEYPLDRPIFIGDGPAPSGEALETTAVYEMLRERLIDDTGSSNGF